MIRILTILTVLTMPLALYAGSCRFAPKESIFRIPIRERDVVYDTAAEKKHEISVFKCERLKAGEVFLLATGPQIYSPNHLASVPFGNDLTKVTYELKNDPTLRGLPAFKVIKGEHQRRQHFLNKCLEFQVNSNTDPVVAFPNKGNCTVKKVDDKTAVLSGNMCALKISPKTSWDIEVKYNKQCLDRVFLNSENISYQDVVGSISGFVVPQDNIGKMGYNYLGKARFRLSIEPPEDVTPISVATGGPRWPTTVAYDVHQGDIKINVRDYKTQVRSGVLVDHRCRGKNKEYTQCNFNVGFGSLKTLSELSSDGSTSPVSTWYNAMVLPPMWKGLLPQGLYEIDYPISEGKRYRLTTDVSYPDIYYRQSNSNPNIINIPNLSIDPTKGFGSMGSLGTSGGLGDLGSFGGFSGIPGMGNVNGGIDPNLDFSAILDNILKNLAKLLGVSDNWPPYYERFCTLSNPKNCKRIYNGLDIKVHVDFTIKEIKEDGQAVLTNITTRRTSNILKEYVRTNAKLPEVVRK